MYTRSRLRETCEILRFRITGRERIFRFNPAKGSLKGSRVSDKSKKKRRKKEKKKNCRDDATTSQRKISNSAGQSLTQRARTPTKDSSDAPGGLSSHFLASYPLFAVTLDGFSLRNFPRACIYKVVKDVRKCARFIVYHLPRNSARDSRSGACFPTRSRHLLYRSARIGDATGANREPFDNCRRSNFYLPTRRRFTVKRKTLTISTRREIR